MYDKETSMRKHLEGLNVKELRRIADAKTEKEEKERLINKIMDKGYYPENNKEPKF